MTGGSVAGLGRPSWDGVRRLIAWHDIWVRMTGSHHSGSAASDGRITDKGRARNTGSHRTDPNVVVSEAFDTFQRDVHSFALHATRDPDAAADATQEAFVRLLREVRDRGIPAHVRSWLFTVVSNLVVSGHRKRSVLDRYRAKLARPDVSLATPERSVLDRERRDRVHEALGHVSPDARTALLLAAEGYSGREIAEMIGRSELATRSLVCRAKGQLRDYLGGFEEAS